MKTIGGVYFEALKNGYEEASVRYILEHITGLRDHTLISGFHHEFRKERYFRACLSRLDRNEPVQYIVKKAYFGGLELYVDKNVLIPRPETEEMADYIVRLAKKKGYKSLLDIGTGSGAIALAVKKRLPSLEVVATDISRKALKVAKINSDKLDIDIAFMHGDGLRPLIDGNIKADLIVSNPPYIYQSEILDDSVIDYEPRRALFSENLEVYRKIFRNAGKVLNENGRMILEINPLDKFNLVRLQQKYLPDYQIKFLEDISGHIRFIILKRIYENPGSELQRP